VGYGGSGDAQAFGLGGQSCGSIRECSQGCNGNDQFFLS
jgi:hypothetical protein